MLLVVLLTSPVAVRRGDVPLQTLRGRVESKIDAYEAAQQLEEEAVLPAGRPEAALRPGRVPLRTLRGRLESKIGVYEAALQQQEAALEAESARLEAASKFGPASLVLGMGAQCDWPS